MLFCPTKGSSDKAEAETCSSEEERAASPSGWSDQEQTSAEQSTGIHWISASTEQKQRYTDVFHDVRLIKEMSVFVPKQRESNNGDQCEAAPSQRRA